MGVAILRDGVVDRPRKEAILDGGLAHTLLAPLARRLKGTAIVPVDLVAERSGGGVVRVEAKRRGRRRVAAQPANRLPSKVIDVRKLRSELTCGCA